MVLIALETSGTACSVAIGDAGRLVAARTEPTDRRQAARLPPMIRELAAEAGTDLRRLDGVVVGIGPGSFTGLRIALAAAKGLCIAARCGLAGVDGFRAYRAGARLSGVRDTAVLVCLGGLRDAVFAAAFRADDSVAIAPRVVALDRLAETVVASFGADAALSLVGAAARPAADRLEAAGLRPSLPAVSDTAEAAWLLDGAGPLVFADPATVAPLYLKEPDVARPAAATAR